MKPRTEDEILARTPLSVKLGDKDYSIPLLAVMAQREWRKNLFAELGPILDPLNTELSGQSGALDMTAFLQHFRKGVSNGLTAALLQFPDKMIELVFAYREYGYAWASVARTPGIKAEEIGPAFLAVLAKGPLEEASDFPRAEILTNSTEEQMASSFSAVMTIAFPSLPQIEMVRNLMKSAAAMQRSASSTS